MKSRRTRLRLRLLLSAMAAIMGALVIAWLVMVMLFDRHIERRVQDELQTVAVPLFAGLELDAEGALAVESPPFDPRFELPGSGMYWQVSHGPELLRSRSLWDESLAATELPVQARGWHDRRVDGPFGQRVLQTERWITLEDADLPILIQVAQSETQLLAARNQFAREMALFLAILWVVLVAAAWLQVRFGLQPLSMVQSELSHLQQSPEARLSHNHPVVIAPRLLAEIDVVEHVFAEAEHRLSHVLRLDYLVAIDRQEIAQRRAVLGGKRCGHDGFRANAAPGASASALCRGRHLRMRTKR